MNYIKKTTKGSIDPVGAEFLPGVVSTLVTVIATLHQFGVFARKRMKFLSEFEDIHREIMRLQNSLDDFVLLVQRYTALTQNEEIEQKNITIAGTLMNLHERDYYRWMDLQDAIKHLDQKIYAAISKIRKLGLRYSAEQSKEVVESDLIESFDSLLLKIGQKTFVEFVKELRTLIRKTAERLTELVKQE